MVTRFPDWSFSKVEEKFGDGGRIVVTLQSKSEDDEFLGSAHYMGGTGMVMLLNGSFRTLKQ